MTKRHAYTITIANERDWVTLRWLADRGYDAGIYETSDLVSVDLGGSRVLGLSESDAWDCRAEYDSDPSAFLACCASDTLNAALLGFIDSIV